MDWRGSLVRSQSLKSVSSDKPVWTDVTLRDKRTSVSQLVSRYQCGVSQQIQTTTTISVEVKPQEELIQAWRPHLSLGDLKEAVDDGKECDEIWKNDVWNEPKSPSALSRSKSLSSLTHSTVSIHSLKAKFEPKAAPQNQEETFKSGYKRHDMTQMSKREPERRQRVDDALKVSDEAPVNDVATKAKQTGSNVKGESNAKIPRRKTIGGIDFEKLAASQAEEKRRSIADFRDSSEKVCVSVKAISALYLSKVHPQEPKAQVRSELGKRPRLAKMTEDSKDDIFPLALEGEQSGYQQRVAIETMQQRRRKNELKRLLKHTHPEITMLDKVVDKELAADDATAETGYEGEVFSKCLIFENCTANKKESCFATNVSQETEKRGSTPTVLEEPVTPGDPNKEFIDEEVRIDVQSTRRMFEEQSMNPTQSCQNKLEETVGDKAQQKTNNYTNPIPQVQKDNKQITNDTDSTDQDHHEVLDDDFASISDSETFGGTIKTSIDLFRHNPFITVNVEKEHASFQSPMECIHEGDSPNVKNRKQLFESMPFDKIRQQNKDDIETLVENIKETLHFLYSANMLQSKGSIIEVHETMKATKANFILTEMGPEIVYESVGEAGAQNLILQLLPRSNIQPHIKYLKEDSHGAVISTTVNAPGHHPHSDTDFKTAYVVQLIEDILNQDNSLRKGVLILDEVDHCAQVSVYSLYHYIDTEDIKSYSPSQQAAGEEAEPEISETIKNEIPQQNTGIIKSAIHCLQETQTESCTASVRMDIAMKGNVKLFKSCIEKGDMEYLKSLQAEAETLEEELSFTASGNNATQQQSENASDSEYEPVDVKRLKSLFTVNSIQTEVKPEVGKKAPKSTSKLKEKFKTATDYKAQDKQQSNEAKVSCVMFADEESIHQAEIVEVLDECDEISNLQAAISELQKATVEAKSIHDSLRERKDHQPNHQPNQAASEHKNTLSTPSKMNEDTRKAESGKSSVPDLDSETNLEDEELVLEGKLQAALQALEKSNINVTRGGFEAAMLYRNANRVSSSTKASTCATSSGETGSCTDIQEVKNVERISEESASESVIEKCKKTQRPKPALPPKPEHLKVGTKESVKTNGAAIKIQHTEESNIEKVGEYLGKMTNDCVGIPEASQSTNIEKSITEKQDVNILNDQKIDKEEPDESHVNFHEACQIFGGKKTALKKTAPVKPKRVKIATADNKSQEQTNSSSSTLKEAGAKVNMRVKKVHKETDDERRQRLSVHMDEIMRGNITAAMEIFDNLRKQEELENILIRVEEIEQDTSEVDVKSLRKVFEDVPDWVVSSDKKKNKAQPRDESPFLVKPNSETKTPIAHVFGDLARASEEIIHLKEQTLARLLDIEEAIKKALYSVSNLKSESDIAGLSSLFKESLGGQQTSNSSGNIQTISIRSSRTKSQDKSVKTKENQSGVARSPKQGSPTSSPAFISIQSAARRAEVPPEMMLCPSCQNAPKPDETFRTTQTVQCNSPVQVRKAEKQCPPKPKRELSLLKVQTDPKGTKKKTVTENYERTDNLGNKFYSTKTSTVLTTEPQVTIPCPVQTVVGPAVHQVSTFTRLPVNKKP